MRTFFLVVMLPFLFFSASSALASPPVYDFDREHMRILFRINHAGFSQMIGEIPVYQGYFTFDRNHPELSSVRVTMDPASIRTSSEKLDRDLEGKDFFDVAAFPEMSFVSTAVKVTGENTGLIEGNLTMHGVTRPVMLEAEFHKEGDFMGVHKAGFSLKGALHRSEYGMSAYIPVVSDKVTIEIEGEGIQRNATPGVQDKKKQNR